MTYQPVTPFRRAVDAAVLTAAARAEEPLGDAPVNKWDVLRNLVTARMDFGLSDRALVVLQGLLSFHPQTELSGAGGPQGLIVFPSNAALCERLNGMASSTMRRHLADLLRAGLLLRRDSPNGKRFVCKGQGGQAQVFGFDLSPLVALAGEIATRAEATRAAEQEHRRLRQTVSVMRRDLAALAEFGAAEWGDATQWQDALKLAEDTRRALRRKLTGPELLEWEEKLAAQLSAVRGVIASTTEEISTSAHQNEQHLHNSNTNDFDKEPCLEKQEAATGEPATDTDDAGCEGRVVTDDGQEPPNIPLRLVMTTCREIQTYAGDGVRNWTDLARACDEVRPMMGISADAWAEAQRAMGPLQASVVLAAMLERYDEIRSPGGYLRSLARKAGQGAFSCGPMVMALYRREGSQV